MAANVGASTTTMELTASGSPDYVIKVTVAPEPKMFLPVGAGLLALVFANRDTVRGAGSGSRNS